MNPYRDLSPRPVLCDRCGINIAPKTWGCCEPCYRLLRFETWLRWELERIENDQNKLAYWLSPG